MSDQAFRLLVLATLLVLAALVIAGPYGCAGALSCLLDVRVSPYGAAQARAHLATFSPDVLWRYLWITQPLDTVFPALYALALRETFARRAPARSAGFFGRLAVFAAGIDYLENALVRVMLKDPAGFPEIAAPAASALTIAKWLAIAVLLGALGRLLWTRRTGATVAMGRGKAEDGRAGMIFTVAIDGPAAAGKGTISRAVAQHFGFAHLDTGLLYRAVGAKGGDPVAAARGLTEADLARDGLRTLDAGQAASRVAVIPEVRTALVAFQRQFARREGGAVLDGRDIGTVICPEAEMKLYVTASAAVRAHRRWLEVGGDEAQVLIQVIERDRRDAERETAPMRPAEDALLLDTTELTIDAAVNKAIKAIEQRIGQGRA